MNQGFGRVHTEVLSDYTYLSNMKLSHFQNMIDVGHHFHFDIEMRTKVSHR